MIKQVDSSRIAGTSFHGTEMIVCPKELITAFPDFEPGCGKTTREWVFDMDGQTFTLYDWKETSDYESGLPPYEEFWSQGYVKLHIGSRAGKAEELDFKRELQSHISDVLFYKRYELLRVEKVFARASGSRSSGLFLRGPSPLGTDVTLCVARVWRRGDSLVFDKFGLATVPDDWKIQTLEKLKQSSSKYREQFRAALLESL